MQAVSDLVVLIVSHFLLLRYYDRSEYTSEAQREAGGAGRNPEQSPPHHPPGNHLLSRF